MINGQQKIATPSGIIRILSGIDRMSDRTLWLMVFVYVLLVALFIQRIALPVFLPQLDSGNGLLIRTDTAFFQQLAVEQSEAIRENGWSAWTLYPQGESAFSIAGIASAVYALANSDNPALLIPLNALVHATSAIILLNLIVVLTNSRRGAVAACLPFVLFPSSLNWVAQIHKDGIFILGMLLTLYGLARLARFETWKHIKQVAFGYALTVLGCATTWLIRPYGLQLIFVFTAIIYVPSILLVLFYVFRKRIPFGFVFAHAVIFAVLLIGITGFLRSPISQAVEPGEIEAVAETFSDGADPLNSTVAPGGAPVTPLPLGGADQWRVTSWLPSSLDQQLHTLSIFRDNVLTFGGDTDIDRDARMSSALDFIAYGPRATQIALFAPFPNQWFGSGALGILSVMRPIVGLEMLIAYLLFPFVLYAIWRWRYPQVWVTIAFCLFFMVLYSYITPNAGTLHRVRYGFMTALLAVGIAALYNLGLQRWGLKTNPLTADKI